MQDNLSQFSFEIYEDIHKIKDVWDLYTPNDVYWHSSYHLALFHSPPSGLVPYFCLVKSDDKIEGIIYFQHKKINLAEAIRLKKENWQSKLLKKLLLANLNMDTLVVGNLLLTGKYGFHFHSLDLDLQYEIVNSAIDFCAEHLRKKKISIGPILMKDFFEDEVYSKDILSDFTKFVVQPNMVMNMPVEWSSMKDYSDALKAKSRTRYNKALSKFENITSNYLELDDLRNYRDQMYVLYSNITNNVDFNLFFLHKDYFISLKESLKDMFSIKGYFDSNNQLVGFSTMLNNKGHLDSHFLGYNIECNKESQLYLNMLFDMVDHSINHKLSKIVMSRTAMEIKSSVGAKPYKMYCYLKHRSKFYNRLVPRIVNYLYKELIWEERNPFK